MADQFNNRIQAFTANGVFVNSISLLSSTIAPWGVAFNNAGTQFVVSSQDTNVARVYNSSTGALLFTVGTGTSGSGNGQFQSPQGVTVQPGTGNIFVADGGNNRIQFFSPAGAFLGAFGSGGTGNGQLSNPNNVAFEPGTGNLYVADQFNGRIQVFTPSGGTFTYLRQFSVSNPSQIAFGPTGNVLISSFGDGWFQYTPTGTLVNSSANGNAGGDGIALGLDGRLYVASGNNTIRVYTTPSAAAPEPGTLTLVALVTFAGSIITRRRRK